MKFLRALWQLTGRRYPPWALLHSPETLGVDSLTFIELISELEEETGQCLDKFAAKLYRTKFFRWSGILKEMRREAMKEKLASYLSDLYNYNPKAVGGKLPLDDFYYGA